MICAKERSCEKMKMETKEVKLIGVTARYILTNFVFFNCHTLDHRSGHVFIDGDDSKIWNTCSKLRYFCVCQGRRRLFCDNDICIPCSFDRCDKCILLS